MAVQARVSAGYGLRVDGAVDERTDPVKSSHAAAQMLADLFAEFGGDASLIAVVSYNVGTGEDTGAPARDRQRRRAAGEAGNAATGTSIGCAGSHGDAMAYVPRLVAAALLDDSTQ